MAEIQTNEATLESLRQAIESWHGEALGLTTQATARVGAVEHELEVKLRRHLQRRSALESALNACDDDRRRSELQSELNRCDKDIETLRRALAVCKEAVERARRLGRWVQSTAASHASAADSDLKNKLRSIESYRAGSVGSSASAAAPSGVGSATSSSDTDYPDEPELKDVELSNVDFSDNPIIDGFGRGGASQADYRWAVETWESTVKPGVLKGMTHDDFVRRDAERGATGFRQTARVHEMFLGTDRIVLSPKGNGTYDVTNGRHRIEVARSLGISRLPGAIK